MNNLAERQLVETKFILRIIGWLAIAAETFGGQKILKKLLLIAVKIYQQYLSPYKGFSCAYRVLHQKQSCSNYLYSCLTKHNISHACILFQQRLIDCQQAHLVLQTSSEKRRSSKRRRADSSCAENNNCIDCRDIFDLEFCLDVLPF